MIQAIINVIAIMLFSVAMYNNYKLNKWCTVSVFFLTVGFMLSSFSLFSRIIS